MKTFDSSRKTLTMSVLNLFVMIAGVQAQWDGNDDFNTASSDSKWLADVNIGHGQLSRTNQHLEYSVASPDLVNMDEAYHPWKLNQPSYATDWEVLVDIYNAATPAMLNQVATFGIKVFNASKFDDYAYVLLYASTLSEPSLRRGFKADLALNGTELNEYNVLGDTGGNLGIVSGSVRMVFGAATKVFTAYYDRGNTNGYRWEKLASFGINGGGGATTNANWGMTNNAPFQIALYGYSYGLVINRGDIYADNFFVQAGMTNLPTLSIHRSSGQVELRWLQAALGYELEANTVLTPSSWTNVLQLPLSLGGTNILDMSIEGLAKFFRLRKQ